MRELPGLEYDEASERYYARGTAPRQAPPAIVRADTPRITARIPDDAVCAFVPLRRELLCDGWPLVAVVRSPQMCLPTNVYTRSYVSLLGANVLPIALHTGDACRLVVPRGVPADALVALGAASEDCAVILGAEDAALVGPADGQTLSLGRATRAAVFGKRLALMDAPRREVRFASVSDDGAIVSTTVRPGRYVPAGEDVAAFGAGWLVSTGSAAVAVHGPDGAHTAALRLPPGSVSRRVYPSSDGAGAYVQVFGGGLLAYDVRWPARPHASVDLAPAAAGSHAPVFAPPVCGAAGIVAGLAGRPELALWDVRRPDRAVLAVTLPGTLRALNTDAYGGVLARIEASI